MQHVVYQGKMTDEKLISHDNLLMGEKRYIISNIYNQDNKYVFGKESTNQDWMPTPKWMQSQDKSKSLHRQK